MGAIPVFPGNPRHSHEFLVKIDGFDAGWFQKANIPEVEVEVDEFNPLGSVRATKFGGRFTVGDCTLEKGVPADRPDNAAWGWLTQAANTRRGELGNPPDYRRDVELQELDHVGNVIRAWILKEAFCSKISWSDFKGESSEHIVETLTLTVGDIEMR